MSNSQLVEYVKLSPNNSGARTHAIDRITPHCVVGQCSVESLGEIFAKTSRKASSNYGIGTDGKVAMYVEEDSRSWCSSSNPNDQRAVTIECASDTTEPYAFNDKVYEKLILLCADICKRNGKNKVVWIEDKEKALKYTPASNEIQFTVHRWFAKKACPGAWLMERMQDLTDKVNALLLPQTELVGKSIEEKIWNYLIKWLPNEFAVAGIMGNLKAESNFKPNNVQNSYNSKLNLTDEEYTSLVDNDNYHDFLNDKAGYGLAQWTIWPRKQLLLDTAKQRNASIADLQVQLDVLISEITANKSLMTDLTGAVSVRQSAEAILKKYEKPADQSKKVVDKRTEYSESIYNQFHVKEKKIYRVQAGAFTIKSNAENLSNALKDKGYNTIIKTVDINGRTIYRVQVGAFSNKLNADTLVVSLKKIGVEAIVVS